MGTKKAKKKKMKKVTAELLANAHLRQLLINAAGENALAVIREFSEEMSDDELARKCRVKLSEVRTVLNKLHSFGLVGYTRIRDKDSGWYHYLWKVNEGRERELVEYERLMSGDGERTVLSDDKELYVCRGCGEKDVYPFEVAFDHKFKCPSCKRNLEHFEVKR